ncbi:MAG: hypothetical protein Q9225_005566 [Loekoesia sp. 1 TL-2023]
MVTDRIDQQRYNILLRTSWEAEETYNFIRFHVPGCKNDKPSCECGMGSKKELWAGIRLRRDMARERKKNASESTDSKEEPKFPAITGKLEEPGDGDFVIGAKDKPKEGSGTPKGRKKTVKFVN